MLINIIFISKQTKIADFHTLYIMRCRHPKETATLKKNRNVTPTAFLTHRHLRAGQFKPAQPSGIRTNSVRATPRKKTGRHRRSPLHKLSNATSFAGKRNTFAAPLLAQAARRQIASAQPHGPNSLAASQFRPPAGLKTALNVGQNRRSARK